MTTTTTNRRDKIAARKASYERMLEARTIAQRALETCTCPECGAKVHRNLALTGWVQCDRFGAEGFRRDTTGPACGWQGFTQ